MVVLNLLCILSPYKSGNHDFSQFNLLSVEDLNDIILEL